MSEILIYGDIGFEVQAKDIVGQLNNMDGPVDVRVDSYGGDVYAGISILNALRRYPDAVTVYVDGMAASAASFIAVGGADTLVMSPNSSLLIHGAWSQGMGNSEEMAQLSADLNQITDNLATIYAEKTGKESSYWRELMKKDTTFTAEQAVESGLADMVGEFEKSVQASKRHAVMASRKSRFAATHGGVPEIESRAAAPPPPLAPRSESGNEKTTKPLAGRKGDSMSIQNLAQELGVEPDELRKKLSGFFNESVQISGEVEVTYPEDVKVAPTEKVTVEPIIGEGDGTAGLAFEIGTVAEGFTAEVDEAGVLSITAPAGVEPGDKAEFSVKVNDVEVPVTAEVKAVSEESAEESTGGEEQLNPAPGETVTLDMETFNEMKAAARLGWEAKNAADKKAREDEVDTWIREGRINPVRRAQVVNEMHRDPAAARALFGAIPKNTIPMAELGYSKSDDVVRETNDKNFNARAVAAARRKEVK